MATKWNLPCLCRRITAVSHFHLTFYVTIGEQRLQKQQPDKYYIIIIFSSLYCSIYATWKWGQSACFPLEWVGFIYPIHSQHRSPRANQRRRLWGFVTSDLWRGGQLVVDISLRGGSAALYVPAWLKHNQTLWTGSQAVWGREGWARRGSRRAGGGSGDTAGQTDVTCGYGQGNTRVATHSLTRTHTNPLTTHTSTHNVASNHSPSNNKNIIPQNCKTSNKLF